MHYGDEIKGGTVTGYCGLESSHMIVEWLIQLQFNSTAPGWKVFLVWLCEILLLSNILREQMQTEGV